MRGKKFIITGIALVAFFLVLIFAIISVARTAIRSISVSPAQPGALHATASVVSSSFFDYNNSAQIAEYALIDYSLHNASKANASISVYTQNPIRRVYLVNTSQYSIDSFNEQALYENLTNTLNRFGLLINQSSFAYVPMQDLQQISNSIIIIQSGLMPLPLLENYSISIFRMLDKGNTLIYIGRNFSNEIDSSGIIFVTPSNVTSKLASYGISTVPAVVNASVKSTFGFSKPTFYFSNGNRQGNVAYVGVHNGTIIAFSNYPTASWRNASALAESIASSIGSDFWINRVAYGMFNISTANASGELGLFTKQQSIAMPNNTAAFAELNDTYSLVRLTASNATGFLSVTAPFVTRYSLSGTLSMPSVVSDTQNISIGINTTSSSQSQFHIDVLSSNMSYVTSIGILHSFVGPVQIVLTQSFSIPSGTYIALLRNQMNKNYTAAIFSVANLSVTPISLNFKNGTFSFSVYSGTFPVNSKAQISFDNTYKEIVPVSGGVLEYNLPKGTIISYGTQTFDILIFGQRLNYTATYAKEILHIPTFYIEIGVVLLAILLLNIVLKPPNRDEYYIDVPTFIPEKQEVMKIKQADLLSVFEKVNYYYHWSFMPLTIDEFKNGISSYIRYNNMPVSVTTQNAQLLIDLLTKSGSVVEKSGYYALSSWLSISKHDMEYLVTFRALRDYCVEHAILFTELNADPNADMLITKKGRQAKVMIYSSEGGIRKFEIDKNDSIFIAFVSSEAKAEFKNRLYDSFTKTAEVLKIAIQYGHVKLVSIDDLSGLMP
ncbi:MAG: hypothetical protein QW091_00300 [Candidatus Micrarchaeaceae archaeon]